MLNYNYKQNTKITRLAPIDCDLQTNSLLLITMHEFAYLLQNSHKLGFDKRNEKEDNIMKIANLENDFYEIIQETLKECNEILSSDGNSNLKKDASICCENLLKYFSNHEDNWFAKASYNVLPRCLEMTMRDRKIAIDI